MANTRKPAAKKAPAKSAPTAPVEVTPVSAWKQPNPPLPLPSGNAMKIRRANFQAFMAAGIIPNSLMAIVQSAIDKGKEPDISKVTEDPQQVNDMIAMMDGVICFVAIDPPVHPVPKSEDDRDDELLYVDEIDDEDKSFIFGVCTGGTRDVEQFRRESSNFVAPV